MKICAQDLEEVDISINKWWKTRYPEYKIRVVSKKEFELIKMQAKKGAIKLLFGKLWCWIFNLCS